MPIDERLRSGLSSNADLLAPDLERALTATYDRARGRQRVRRGATGLVAAAVVAVAAWAVEASEPDSDVRPVSPVPTSRDLVGVRGSLDPGTYSMGVWGGKGRADRQRRVSVTVPEGFFSQGGYVVDAGSDGSPEADQYGEVSVWEVDRVPTDPCDVGTVTEVGPSVADLADAVGDQPGRSTPPRPVEIDGHRGLFLEVTMPPRLDPDRCTNQQHALWQTADGSLQDQGHDGASYRMWILDVDGTRLVVLSTLYPDQDPYQYEQQTAIAESIRFAPPGE